MHDLQSLPFDNHTGMSDVAPIPLLATKLYIPLPRPALVARPRLLARITAALHCKLILLAAPAGFGKTTLLSAWRASSTGQQVPMAWVSLDEGDNDPVRFWAYVLAALDQLPPWEANGGISQGTLQQLRMPQPPPIEWVLNQLINTLSNLPHDSVLVLDDYHTITAEPIHRALMFLLEHLPPQLHLIITSRSDPLLPLARLRVRGELLELRAADLRFTVEEAQAFLNDVMGLQLSIAEIAALETRTEGWIAGLQLAALSMQGVDDIGGFVDGFTGSHRHVVDYLMEEVLKRQPPAVQQFLLRTSILDRLNAPLCDALLAADETGPLEPVDNHGAAVRSAATAHELLSYLERANLFLVPLDHERHLKFGPLAGGVAKTTSHE